MSLRDLILHSSKGLVITMTRDTTTIDRTESIPKLIIPNDDQYILNHCTKYLARKNTDGRHNFGQFLPEDARANICEAWRFPIIDSYAGTDALDSYAFNKVTFIYQVDVDNKNGPAPAVIGDFNKLYEPIALSRVLFLNEPTGYYAVSVRVPKARYFRYKFIVSGQLELDPINPQQVLEANGNRWSRFFTHLCTQPLSFEIWEFTILERLTDHIMPFRTKDGQNFLARYYQNLDKKSRETQYAFAYRLDQSVGIVNFIDNLLAREERHRLNDYKICLKIISDIIRQRAPNIPLEAVPKDVYVDIYSEMSSGQVTGWDYPRYNDPRNFLEILRRHAFTGAFSHPKYGGNVGALGWLYLEDSYTDANGHTLFDWKRSIEPPLGESADYRG